MPQYGYGDEKEVKSGDEAARFVMSCISESDEVRSDFLEIWQQSLANYLVKPASDSSANRTDWPYATSTSHEISKLGGSVMKDPESHQIVETYLAKLWTSLFSEQGFIQARRVGIEDVGRSMTASRLLEYALSIQGHPRTFYEWLKDGLIYGTGILEVSWEFIEDERQERVVMVDPMSGIETAEMTPAFPHTLYDDVRIRNVDIMDFFPDPGAYRLDGMTWAAKRICVSKREAQRKAESGEWDADAVKKAISNYSSSSKGKGGPPLTADDLRSDIEGMERQYVGEYGEMVGYEFWGEAPWKQKGGKSRYRVITVLCGETVRNRDWPLLSTRVPFYDVTFNPICGKLYGYSELEAIRFDQEYLDVMKMMMADATIKMVLPPHIYNRNSRPDLAKLRRFGHNTPIGVDGDPRGSIATGEYRPDMGPVFNMYSTVKGQAREGSGALGAIQGLGLGSKRFSASESVETFRQASDRPEMMAQLIERDSLPPIGQAIIQLYQRFLDDGQALALRIGEAPESVSLSDIMVDFDIKFVGSRQQHNRQTKIQALERFIATVGSVPFIASQVPWDVFLRDYVRTLDVPEMESAIANPAVVQNNMNLQAQLGQPANPPGATGALSMAQRRGGVL